MQKIVCSVYATYMLDGGLPILEIFMIIRTKRAKKRDRGKCTVSRSYLHLCVREWMAQVLMHKEYINLLFETTPRSIYSQPKYARPLITKKFEITNEVRGAVTAAPALIRAPSCLAYPEY